MALKDYPEWVLAHRGKGKEIRHINGKYYLYLYHNEKVGDVRKKITDKYLGRITKEGLIPPVEKANIKAEINRIISMIDHSVKKTLKELSLEEFKVLLLPIYIVNANNSWTLVEVSDDTKTIIDKYNIKLEIKYGQVK